MKNITKMVRRTDTEKQNFTPISNGVLQNTEISFEARGLLSYMLSLPKDWIISKEQIMKSNNVGLDRFRRMWKELETAGYIKSKRLKNDKGEFYWSYNISDKPIVGLSTDGSPTDGLSTYGLSTDGKPTDIKKKQEQKKQEQKKYKKKIDEESTSTSTGILYSDTIFDKSVELNYKRIMEKQLNDFNSVFSGFV